MPLLPHKRRGGPRGGSSRRRPDGSPDEPWVTGPAYESRYHEIVASRLAQLQLPVRGSDLAGLPDLPSSEILQTLTRKSFHDDESRDALVEYQCQNSSEEIRGPDIQGIDSDSGGESEPEDVTWDEEYTRTRQVLAARVTEEIDTYTRLDQEQTNKLHFKRALYLIKACLLLKGKPVAELDASALEHKYPPEFILEHRHFFHFANDGCFGWYFDFELCYIESLSDYQRLVLFNDGGDEYTSWSRYRAFFNTPEADRDYLRYWETLVKKIKWLKKYVLRNGSTLEWVEIRSKASIQAISIAAEFPQMTIELAGVALAEYIWNMRAYLLFVKDRDGMYYEIWRQVNVYHQGFRDAVKRVYDKKLFPAQERNMEYELQYGNSKMDLHFRQCTGGLTKDVPEHRARKIIAQEIYWRGGLSGTYAQYARKKLKIAELLGLIPRDKMVAG